MSKLFLLLAATVAFVYAVMLALARRPAPALTNARGFRRRFYLATALFLAFLTGCEKQGPDAKRTCYVEAVPRSGSNVQSADTFVATARQVWQALSQERTQEFKRTATAAAERGEMRDSVAALLANAYQRLSFHAYATGRDDGDLDKQAEMRITCYEPSMTGGIEYTSAEAALKQIAELRRMRRDGTIDEATARKAYLTLLKELAAMERLADLREQEEIRTFVEAYQNGTLEADETVAAAAAYVLKLEEAPVPATDGDESAPQQ